MNNDVYIVLWIVQHANFQKESVGTWADEHVEVLSLEDRHIRSVVRMQDVGDADAVTLRRWTDFGPRRLPAHRRATYERSMRAASYFPALEEELALQRRDNDRLGSRLRRFRAEAGDLGRARRQLADYAERINEAKNRTMLAHIRISQGESSPRLHFLDDTLGKTGKIHIGYIGPHLPTARDPK